MGATAPRILQNVLLVLVIGLGVAWPMAGALSAGQLPGAGPDVLSTTWGAWWLSEVGPWGLTGLDSALLNHPFGARGTVLSPVSTGLTAALMGPLGPAWAVAIAVASQVLGLAAATALLGRVSGLGPRAALLAGAAVLVGRCLLFGAGEASVVAIAALPIPLGLAALLRLEGRFGPLLAAGAAAAAGWSALENPYLAPVLPVVALGMALARPRGPAAARLLGAALGGAALVAGVVLLFAGGASPDYPREIDGTVLTLGPWSFTVVDEAWARVRPGELVWGGPVRWTTTADSAVNAGGGRSVGLSVLALAAAGAWKRPRKVLPWLGLAAGALLLAAGSVQGDVGLPFLYLNTALDLLARPLTQPVRFLAVALVALAVAAGWGAQALCGGARGPWIGAALLTVMALDCALLGAGSLTLPGTPLPAADCLAGFDPAALDPPLEDGAVLVWPWDARDSEPGRSQLLQLVHGRPAAHRGIASWALLDQPVAPALRGAGFRLAGAGPAPRLEALPLRMLGYRWVVAEPEADPAGAAWLAGALGPPLLRCGDVALFSLGR